MEGGKVTIDIIVTDKNLILMISDNGKGMDADTLKELNAEFNLIMWNWMTEKSVIREIQELPFLIFIRESNFYLEKSMV